MHLKVTILHTNIEHPEKKVVRSQILVTVAFTSPPDTVNMDIHKQRWRYT
jgi:hypothetical protein